MGYKSIAVWRDLTDGHLYRAGDAFPHDGREISEARIRELSGSQNKAGSALIKAEVEKESRREEEPPKKAVRTRKKTV